MTDLVDFLRARLEDEEQAARAAMWAGDERWSSYEFQHASDTWNVDDSYDEGVALVRAHAADSQAVARHIALHDPVRVLADLAAKRAVIDLHVAEDGQHPDFCGHDRHELPCPTLRLLASVYADHPDYRKEWTT